MIVTLLTVALVGLVFYFGVSFGIAYGIAASSRKTIERTPASLGLAYQDVSFGSRRDNVMLKGWYLPAGGKGTIIVMHGGKQNRADATMKLLELCGDLARQGFNILTFDRRGCGASEVSRYKGRGYLERDFGGAVDYIRRQNGSQEKIFLLGSSVGAVAAFIFAYQEEGISGIIADSCFANTSETVRGILAKKGKIPMVFTPGAMWLGKVIYGLERGSAIDRVGAVTCPILFIHGAEDDGIPIEDAHQLFQASNNPLDELWIAPDAGHSQAYRSNASEYIRRVTVFLTSKCSTS